MSATLTSLPVKPLEDLARTKAGDGVFTDTIFADIIGVSSRAISRWRAAGNEVPWPSADVAACNMGLHPLLVWGEEWLALDAELLEAERLGENERDRAQRKLIKDVVRSMEKIGTTLAATIAADDELERLAS
jgi:hypothetical protein